MGGVRENVAVQPTVVERMSPIMTQGIVGGQIMETIAAPTYATYAADAQVVEAIAAPTLVGGQVVETFAAPTYAKTFAAPTTFAATTLAAPTYVETVGAQVMQPAVETVVYQQ